MIINETYTAKATPAALQNDSVEMPYQAMYPDGFPNTIDTFLHSNDSIILPIKEIKHPQTAKTENFNDNIFSSDGCSALLLFIIAFFLFSFRSGKRYIYNIWQNISSIKIRKNLFAEPTVNEWKILTALVVNTCFSLGSVFYYAMLWWEPQLVENINIFTCVVAFSLITALYYFAQFAIYFILGFVFSDKVHTQILLDGFKAAFSLVGLFMLPIMLIIVTFQWGNETILIIAAIIYILVRIIFIVKGLRIFYTNLPSILLFILYLCSVEIIPIILMVVSIKNLCLFLNF